RPPPQPRATPRTAPHPDHPEPPHPPQHPRSPSFLSAVRGGHRDDPHHEPHQRSDEQIDTDGLQGAAIHGVTHEVAQLASREIVRRLSERIIPRRPDGVSPVITHLLFLPR